MSMPEHKTAQKSGDQRSSAGPRHSFSLHEGRDKFPQKNDGLSKKCPKRVTEGLTQIKSGQKHT